MLVPLLSGDRNAAWVRAPAVLDMFRISPKGRPVHTRDRSGRNLVSAIVLGLFPAFFPWFCPRGDITEGARDCRRESETPLFPVSRACSILCPTGSGHVLDVRRREETCKRLSFRAPSTPRSWSRVH